MTLRLGGGGQCQLAVQLWVGGFLTVDNRLYHK